MQGSLDKSPRTRKISVRLYSSARGELKKSKKMLIDEEKIWAPSRLINEGKIVSETFSDHNVIILEINWLESLKSKVKKTRMEMNKVNFQQFTKRTNESNLTSIWKQQSEENFNEKYSNGIQKCQK